VGLSKVPSIISVIAMPVIVNVVAPTLGQCDCFGRAGFGRAGCAGERCCTSDSQSQGGTPASGQE